VVKNRSEVRRAFARLALLSSQALCHEPLLPEVRRSRYRSRGDRPPRGAISIAKRTDDGRDATSTPNADADADEGEDADVAVLDRGAVEQKVVPAAA